MGTEGNSVGYRTDQIITEKSRFPTGRGVIFGQALLAAICLLFKKPGRSAGDLVRIPFILKQLPTRTENVLVITAGKGGLVSVFGLPYSDVNGVGTSPAGGACAPPGRVAADTPDCAPLDAKKLNGSQTWDGEFTFVGKLAVTVSQTG